LSKQFVRVTGLQHFHILGEKEGHIGHGPLKVKYMNSEVK